MHRSVKQMANLNKHDEFSVKKFYKKGKAYIQEKSDELHGSLGFVVLDRSCIKKTHGLVRKQMGLLKKYFCSTKETCNL